MARIWHLPIVAGVISLWQDWISVTLSQFPLSVRCSCGFPLELDMVVASYEIA